MTVDEVHTLPAGVLVVGEALIDVVHRLGANSPTEHIGGSPANVALGLARLGRTVRLHTALARDPRGFRIATHLERSGVVVDPRSWRLEATSTARADIQADGSAAYTFDVSWPPSHIELSPSEQMLHVGSIGAYLEPGSHSVLDLLSRVARDVVVTFDPNIRPALIGPAPHARTLTEEISSLSTLVKLSDEDARWLYPDFDERSVTEHLLGLGARIVAITRGGAGSLIRSRMASIDIPVPHVTVQDTVGAGDSYMAGLIDEALQDPSALERPDETVLLRLGTRAAAAAAITVQRSGADLPTSDDIGMQ